MKVKHYFPYAFGCGLFSVANAINRETFITEQRIEESKNLNSVWQLNAWLMEDKSDVHIEPLFVHVASHLPANWFICPDEKEMLMPVIVEMDGHMIAAHIEHGIKGNIILMDSTRTDMKILPTVQWIKINHQRIKGIYAFARNDNNAYLIY